MEFAIWFWILVAPAVAFVLMSRMDLGKRYKPQRRSPPAALIRLTITPAAYAVIVATLPASVGFEPNERP